MVIPVTSSPTCLADETVQLKRRQSSILAGNEDLMNTAFYEPDQDSEVSSTNSVKKPDQWEEWLNGLNKKHPLVSRSLPIAIELLFILFTTLFLTGIGATNSVDRLAGNLYYFLLCFMF